MQEKENQHTTPKDRFQTELQKSKSPRIDKKSEVENEKKADIKKKQQTPGFAPSKPASTASPKKKSAAKNAKNGA